MSRATTALLTDRYEMTMLEASLQSGAAHRASVFEVFARRLPGGRRYGVVAGTGRVLDAIADSTSAAAEIAWVREQRVVGEEALEYLADYRFGGDVLGYGEGRSLSPGSSILSVRVTCSEALLLETVVHSVLNHDSAVAAAASRMTTAAHGRPCLEMGARRTHEEAAVAAARAAVVGGFAGTSVLEAGRSYGLPTIGTAAHSFTLVHDDEEAAFDAQVRVMGPGTTLLVDTYDVERGVERAVAAARRHGGELGAVRLDSGDLVAQAFTVREQLDALGATTPKITVTSDLDEYAIAALGAAPVDSYGVGTKLVTGSGFPTAELVYKLVARENGAGQMEPVAKSSSAKESVGGQKCAGRAVVDNVAAEEIIVAGGSEEQRAARLAAEGARRLDELLVRDGEALEEHLDPQALPAAARRHVASRAELPYAAWRLSEGEPGIPTRHVNLDS